MTARKAPQPPITVTRAVKHKVSMNNYEGVEVFASVTTEVPGDSDFAKVRVELDDLLETLVDSDLAAAAAATAEKKTYIQYWKEDN